MHNNKKPFVDLLPITQSLPQPMQILLGNLMHARQIASNWKLLWRQSWRRMTLLTIELVTWLMIITAWTSIILNLGMPIMYRTLELWNLSRRLRIKLKNWVNWILIYLTPAINSPKKKIQQPNWHRNSQPLLKNVVFLQTDFTHLSWHATHIARRTSNWRGS